MAISRAVNLKFIMIEFPWYIYIYIYILADVLVLLTAPTVWDFLLHSLLYPDFDLFGFTPIRDLIRLSVWHFTVRTECSGGFWETFEIPASSIFWCTTFAFHLSYLISTYHSVAIGRSISTSNIDICMFLSSSVHLILTSNLGLCYTPKYKFSRTFLY